MKNYEKTLWENNVTVVDAEKLNNVENQIQALTINTVQSNNRIQTIEDTLPMKANKDHTHQELHDNVIALQEEFETLKAEIGQELSKYFDNVELEETTLYFYSNNKIVKSIELPNIASNEARAICGEVLCGEVLTNQGLNPSKSTKSYDRTIWEDGITPINAKNLNNIENKIVELVVTVDKLVSNTDTGIHIGDSEPTNKNALWIDHSDEEPEMSLNDSVIEAFSAVLKEHGNQIQELFYLSDAYLDDGDFTDTEEANYILEGGIF